MWKALVGAACLLVGSTTGAAGQTFTEPDSLLFTYAGQELRVRLYRMAGPNIKPAQNVMWASRDTLVATVTTSSGWVQAITGGITWVVATSNHGIDSAHVHVDLPVGPPPLLAPASVTVAEVDSLGQTTVVWVSVEGAEAYELNALPPPPLAPISLTVLDTLASFSMPQLDSIYEGTVCVRGVRPDEQGPDACQVFQVPAAPPPPLAQPTNVQVMETMVEDSIYYTLTWDAVGSADSYEWGAGPVYWDEGVVFRGPTWRNASTTNLVAEFWQVRDLQDYESWTCVKAVRGEERSQDTCLSLNVARAQADSMVIYMVEDPPEQVYLGGVPADTTRPDTLALLWGWDDAVSRLRMKAISLGLEFTLCSHIWWNGQAYDLESSWTLNTREGPDDLVLLLDQPSPSCQRLLVNPDHSGTPAAQNLLSWLAELPRWQR